MSLAAILALGFFLGMRHATDADHVVAVTTIVAKQRSLKSGALIGLLWGLGHTLTILLVGGAIVVLGLVIPPHIGLSMELSVAVMLIVLGLLNITGAAGRFREVVHEHHHEDGRAPVVHSHPVAAHRGILRIANGHWLTLGFRPLIVGVVHGLAGSAAIALLVLATLHDVAWSLLYLVIFGFGTILGMMLLTVALSVPLMAATRRYGSLELLMARATGLLSLVFGLFLAYQIGFVDGLFSGNVHWDPH